MIDFKKLVKAGVHFGHQTSRWCPKMKPYIWGHKNKVHLIDVSQTAFQLEKAAQFLESIAVEGKQILWVGTKKAAQETVKKIAKSLKHPYVVHRWIGGTLSNPTEIKKARTKLLHHEDVLVKSEKFHYYTKKELNVFQKIVNRLDKNIGGIRNLIWPIGAIVLVDVTKELSALREAVAIGIPVIALVDTNGDPSLVDFVIPSNDDAPQAIGLLIDYLAQAVQRGKNVADQKAKEREQEKVKEKEAKKTKEEKTEKKEAAKASKTKIVKETVLVKKTESPKTTEKKTDKQAPSKAIEEKNKQVKATTKKK